MNEPRSCRLRGELNKLGADQRTDGRVILNLSIILGTGWVPGIHSLARCLGRQVMLELEEIQPTRGPGR